LPERDLEELLLPSGKPKLIKLLMYLIVNGTYSGLKIRRGKMTGSLLYSVK